MQFLFEKKPKAKNKGLRKNDKSAFCIKNLIEDDHITQNPPPHQQQII